MLMNSTYTINAICGLLRNRRQVKELVCPGGTLLSRNQIKPLLHQFCIDIQVAFNPESVPSHEKFDPNWDHLVTVALVIGECE